MFFFAFFSYFNFGINTSYAGDVSEKQATAATNVEASQQAAQSGGLLRKSAQVNWMDDCSPGEGFKKCYDSNGKISNKTDNIFITGIKWFLYGIFTFVSWIALVAAHIFSIVLDPKKFQEIMSNAVIYEVWRIVRDFFNLFFIFSLLIVAFSTIFQVSKYGGLKSIWNIVLAALFINFSFPIARMVIDVGNVMMYSFINDMFGMDGDILNRGILSTSGIKGLFLLNQFDGSIPLLYYLVAIVGMFMFGVSFLTLALMMFYRLFMLPILVMFSPIGFAGSAIPGMSGYSSQWWDKLIKNVFFGPIAVFMVMIAVKFLQTLVATSKSTVMDTSVTAGMIAADGVSNTLIASIVYMVIPIIFFWIAITSAEKLSSEASGMANSFGSKFIKWTGKTGGMFAYRKLESKLAKNKYTKFLSPTVVTSAFKDWSDTGKHEDMLPIEMAKAEMHNNLNSVVNRVAGTRLGKAMGIHKNSTDYKMLEQAKQMKKYEDEIKQRGGGDIQEEVSVAALNEGLKDHNSVKVLAAMACLSKVNGLDNMAALATNYGIKPGVKYDMNGKPISGQSVVNAAGKEAIAVTDNYIQIMKGAMEQAGVPEQLVLKHLYNFGETAKSKGDLSYGDWVEIKTDGSYHMRSLEEHAQTVGKNFSKMKAQTRQDVLHGRGLFEQHVGPDGKITWGDMHLSGEAVAAQFNADDVNSHSRNRGDLADALKENFDLAQSADPNVRKRVKNFIETYNKNKDFREYAWAKMGHDPKKMDTDKPPVLSLDGDGQLELDFGA